MPNQTPNYNLTKPLTTENYNIDVFNNNADIIDTALKNIDSQMNEKANNKNATLTGIATINSKTIATTEKLQLTLLNGWIPNDVQPMIVICGNLLCVNMRIKSGTYTAGTWIAETGKTTAGNGGNYFQATDVSGSKIGSVTLTDTGRIEIVGAFSNNADVSINFTATIN